MAKRIFIVGMALAAAWLYLAGAVLAQQQGISPQGVPFLSGGFGLDERTAIDAMAGQYNLKLEFAMAEGNYLGDVRVMLQGPVVLDVISEGPWFLTRVPPGTYRVTAEYAGAAKTQSVSVGAGGLKTVVFRW